jgi:Lsr2
MAQRVVVTDDLDGVGEATTVSFSFEGQHLEIDLSKKNRAAFEKVLKPYLAAARRAGAGRGRSRHGVTSRKSSNGRRSAHRPDPAAVREWAAKNRLPVSTRGRISTDLIEQYLAAH